MSWRATSLAWPTLEASWPEEMPKPIPPGHEPSTYTSRRGSFRHVTTTLRGLVLRSQINTKSYWKHNIISNIKFKIDLISKSLKNKSNRCLFFYRFKTCPHFSRHDIILSWCHSLYDLIAGKMSRVISSVRNIWRMKNVCYASLATIPSVRKTSCLCCCFNWLLYTPPHQQQQPAGHSIYGKDAHL